MSDSTNHVSASSSTAVGGVLSIQERIRAMNATLDNVEQRQKKEQQPAKASPMEHPSDDTEATQNITSEHSISTTPVVKRSSVIDIWRMRENQNAGTATNVANTTERETSSGPKKLASSILRPNISSHHNGVANVSSGRSPTRVHDMDNPRNSQSSVAEQEEKKEDCDNYEISPVGKGVPIRTISSASPTPPKLPGANRKYFVKPFAALKSNHLHEISQQEQVQSYNNSYPFVDLTIVQSTSSLSTSSGAKHFVSKNASSKHDSSNSKVAMIRDKLMQNTTTTTATSNSLPSTSVGSTTNEGIPHEQPSYEEKLISAFIQQSPNNTSSPKRQSVVDIWKNRTVPTTTDDTAIETNGNDPASAGVGLVTNSSIKNQESIHDPDCETKVSEESERKDVFVSDSIAAVQSPTRNNSSVADRWARRLADQKGATTTSSDGHVATNGRDAAKAADNNFAIILKNTFATDLPSSFKSSESDPACDVPPPSSHRKGKVTDRYKVTGASATVPSINHAVSPMISSLVKEHAARTPVLPYKSKREVLPEKPTLETWTINDTTPSGIMQTQRLNSSDGPINAYVSNTVVNVVDRQAEKRRQNFTDRWTVNNHNDINGRIKGKDTSDIPASYTKVTDRYKPKSKLSASEPGISKFDSATVAELLKLHAGKTPAGRVRGGIKQHTNDGQRSLIKHVCIEGNSRSPCLVTESEISPPKRHATVTDRWTSRQPSTSTIEEMKVWSSKVIEPFNTNLSLTQDIDVSDIRPISVENATLPERNLETAEAESACDYAPGTTNKSNVADRWKKRLVQTKENDHMTSGPGSNSFQIHKQLQAQDESVTNHMGNIANFDRHDANVNLSETKHCPTMIGNSQTLLSKTRDTSNIPARSSLNLNNEDGQPLNSCQGQTVSGTESDSRKFLPLDQGVDSSDGTEAKAANVASTFPKLPQPDIRNYENQEILRSTLKDDESAQPMKSSAFDLWNNPGEVSRDIPIRNAARAITSHGNNNVTDYTSQQFNIPSDLGFDAKTECAAPLEIAQSNSSLALSGNLTYRCETDDRIGQDIASISAINPTSVAIRHHDPEKTPLPNPSAAITLSTKKLASDRASNKKRLQQYRGKAKKSLSSKLESARMGTVEDDSSKSESKSSYNASDNFESHAHLANIPPTSVNSNFDLNGLLQSSGNETGQPSKPKKSDVDREVLETIYSSASTSSSSPLASKAERLLQNRRRRSKGEDRASQQVHSTEFSSGPQAHISQNLVDDEAARCDRNGYFCGDQPRLSTRYNTSERFIEADTPTSEPVTLAYDSDSAESSCNESGTTSGSNSGYLQEKRRLAQETKASSKLRKHPLKDPPGQLSKDKSVNLSSHSNWDSDWGGNVSMVSMDFDKFVSVVDEQVAAFRDFVGVGIQRHLKQVKGKPKMPPETNIPMDVEDVAIEVEYVEDSFDDDDPNADLGFCSAPVDDMMRKSLDFSDRNKTKTCGDFQLSCSEMLPTGEPSCERKPNVRKQSKWNAYV